MTAISQVAQLAHNDQDDGENRPARPAVLRGLMGRCPACGEGRILHHYLKIHANCPECGEDLSHARADDGPAYLSILIVAHFVGFALHILWSVWELEPLTMILVVSGLAVGLSLFLLPRFKGMLVGVQWAKRMHGF
ncbi:DUF983 domain-containing protein [uncultured Jannaschia sp.]|uniref:DUF983 domain-containing protein n=1 Tax=uncultured Jannaschia sp. TaxID=293347 RepID=UPI0026184B64|nr:DUF983 domain-containing protein [uncultured Jannaschia sp.]